MYLKSKTVFLLIRKEFKTILVEVLPWLGFSICSFMWHISHLTLTAPPPPPPSHISHLINKTPSPLKSIAPLKIDQQEISTGSPSLIFPSQSGAIWIPKKGALPCLGSLSWGNLVLERNKMLPWSFLLSMIFIPRAIEKWIKTGLFTPPLTQHQLTDNKLGLMLG